MHNKLGKNNEKSKDFKGSIKRLLSNLKTMRILLITSLLLAMTSSILSLAAPNKLSDFTNLIQDGLKPRLNDVTIKEIMANKNITNDDKEQFTIVMEKIKDKKDTLVIYKELDTLPKTVFNKIKPQVNMSKIRFLALFLGCLYLLSAVFSFIQNLIMTFISNKFAEQLRSRINNKINSLPLKYFDNHETGDVLSRVTNDVDTINQNLNNSLATLVTSITLFIGSIIMMFYTNWLMAIAAILASLIGFGFMGLILGKSQKYFKMKQEQLGELNGYIEEMYSGHNVVRVYNGTKDTIKQFNNLNKNLYDSNLKSQFLSGLMHPIMGFVGNLGYVVVCIVGAILVSNNSINIGVIVAFMIYVRLFTNPLTQMAQAMTSLQSVAASSERIFEFIDEEEQNKQEKANKVLKADEVKGEIEFKNVQFGYNEDRTVINNFTALAKPGEKIAIVGPTGAGKTTMVNLLMKFYEIKKGNILIDGIDISELTRENIHELFIMVLQDTWLFNGTIKDNIKFNNENVTDEEIWEACKVVGIEHFIKTLPGGIDANVNDNDTISQGQKQLITIARGMIKNAPFLILDEATSNVDTRTEELVQKAMDKLMKGRTSFVIAHRLSTIKNADLILVMKDGDIIEQGTHEELLDQNNFYADLYNSQFKKENNC